MVSESTLTIPLLLFSLNVIITITMLIVGIVLKRQITINDRLFEVIKEIEKIASNHDTRLSIVESVLKHCAPMNPNAQSRTP